MPKNTEGDIIFKAILFFGGLTLAGTNYRSQANGWEDTNWFLVILGCAMALYALATSQD